MDNTTVTYREITLEDYKVVTEIRMAVTENILTDPTRATHADYVSYVTDVGKGWVAEVAGEIIGFSFANRSGLVWALFMRQGYERRGIGEALLNLCTDWLKGLGLTEAFLDTGAGTQAEYFYRKRGWVEVGRNVNSEGREKIDFKLKLSKICVP